MSEPQPTESLHPSSDLNNNHLMPPRSTPSPDATESGLSRLTYQVHPTYHNPSVGVGLSRKREREVSLEPVTTPTASNVL